MEEIWKDVDGYEGLYQVSNFGRIKSLEFLKGAKNGSFQKSPSKILKQTTNQKGYNVVVLYKNKKGKMFQVHRLVALAFIPNPENLPVINHKDENPQNCSVDNLEWCTQKYNCQYSNNKHDERHKHYEHKGSCKPKKAIIQYDLDDNYIAEYQSIREASKKSGINISSIFRCYTGKRKEAGGYKWVVKQSH